MTDRCRIICGDALKTLKTLESGSIHCSITSPPYFSLRDYRVDGQIGLESSPEEWAARLVEVFRELRRVLRDDGTFWVNCGDAYYSDTKGSGGASEKQLSNAGSFYSANQRLRYGSECKPKDLLGLPWLLAFALRADGWYLRSAITLCKQNPMPESVTDRPTSATEMMFLFAKRERYFYDADAVRISHTAASLRRYQNGGNGANGKPYSMQQSPNGHEAGRNLWNWWPSVSEPSSENHYAAFPTAWVKPCILAGTSEKGCCPNCGAQRVRLIESKPATSKECPKELSAHSARGGNGVHKGTVGKSGGGRIEGYRITTDWKPSCLCSRSSAEPCTVLDPFCGSGTTGLVALRYGRRFIGIELNESYVEMARRRLAAAEAQELLPL